MSFALLAALAGQIVIDSIRRAEARDNIAVRDLAFSCRVAGPSVPDRSIDFVLNGVMGVGGSVLVDLTPNNEADIKLIRNKAEYSENWKEDYSFFEIINDFPVSINGQQYLVSQILKYKDLGVRPQVLDRSKSPYEITINLYPLKSFRFFSNYYQSIGKFPKELATGVCETSKNTPARTGS
ncbi:hypothetical protein ACLB0R_10240 [Sphingomonas sp. GlSt437]|uniref:hypothetical protein n=1 Tax=Sphingomonas sp. GlSt437 TaxID=3389970 RepID=UPI003A8C16FA